MSENVINERLTPGAMRLFYGCMSELTQALSTQPDKPDETAINTLSALWHTAAGRPISARRAATSVLPDLNETEIQRLHTLIRDRIAGTPLAHLTGREQFMGVEFFTSADALIPHDQTALLGDAALAKLRAIVHEQGHAKVIDVCSGSGNLGLALAWHEPRARVWAADRSEDALALARRNLAQLDLAGRVEFRSGDLLAPFDTPDFHGTVDLLICNPPYVSSATFDAMPHGKVAHEPRLAFDGGPLGIRILLRLIAEAPRFLRGGGWLAFKIGQGQSAGIRKRVEQSGAYAELGEVFDKNGQIGALVARRLSKGEALPETHSRDGEPEYVVVVANVMEESARLRSLWQTGLNATNSHEAKFDWYYQRNLEGAPDALFLNRSSDMEAVGVASVGHRRMRFNNATLRAGVLVDFVVRPEHRTLFPALLLQKEMHRFALQTHQMVWGLPNPKASALFGRAGYQCVGQMVRYVRVLHSAEYLARHIPRWMSRVLGPIIDWTRSVAIVLRGLGTRGYVLQWQNRPDARFNDLWERSAKPDQLMGVRDEHYLTWRFIDSPLGRHSFCTLVSIVDQQLIGYAACEFVQRAVRVSDFLVDSNVPGASACLWRELARSAFGMGHASLNVEFLGSELVRRELKTAGMAARDHSPLYAAVTDESPPLLQEGNWYITRADLDV